MKYCAIQISNIPKDTTDETLASFMSECKPSSARLLRLSHDQFFNKGSVEAPTPEVAAKIIEELDGKSFKGWVISVKYDKTDDKNKTLLFIGNVPETFTHEKFSKLFEPYNPVSLSFEEKHVGDLRGIAYAVYHTRELAENAVAKLNGKELGSQVVKVEISNTAVARTNIRFLHEAEEQKLQEKEAKKSRITKEREQKAKEEKKKAEQKCFICGEAGHMKYHCPYVVSVKK
ncbi:RNA-binding protein, putative [Entamoeba invadens IP1]|uniref:RNA-binding protein, putative n=1 Tax=Entamoeba invadens IP1 TaxID=370355 RepID=L7FLG7_ENTIV|nr:RNA-binding protein, putative [Entamoeba invadens IP1]ELP88557.1 RNA-binding protein, putative [Entamoeba invadens IP1]|eukprot:XP_004255328.1 RNA-binding protein, putative [Entamoeba invadens IP1]